MAALIPYLVGFLISIAGTLVGRVLVFLGVGLVSFTGVNTLLSWAKTAAFSYLDSAAGLLSVANYIGLLQIGTCMNIIFSAFAVRMVLKGLQGDTVKRWVTK